MRAETQLSGAPAVIRSLIAWICPVESFDPPLGICPELTQAYLRLLPGLVATT